MAYKFDDHFLKIEIEDAVFSVSMSPELGARLGEVSEKYDRMVEESGGDISKKCSAVDELLDVILGEGSAVKIFDGREDNIYERISVFTYVLEEITKYAHKQTARVKNNAFYSKNKNHRNRRR